MVNDNKTQQEPAAPDASADGRRNAYYHPCRVTGQVRPYAACVARIDGRLSGDPQCESAINGRVCPATSMRTDELNKGQAIYFVERQQVDAFIGAVKTWGPIKTEATSAPMPPKYEKRPATLMEKIEAGAVQDFSDAVNKAAAKVSSTRPMKLVIKPGESPLEAYKRIKGER